MEEYFVIIILLFTSLVILSIAFGSIAVCIKCLKARRRRRLGPMDGQQNGPGDQLDKWPNMASVKHQQEIEESRRQSHNTNGSYTSGQEGNKQVNIQVQPIAGIIVVRPALPSNQLKQIDNRTTPKGIETTENRTSIVRNDLANQKSSSSDTNELDRQQQMEEHREGTGTTSSSSNMVMVESGRGGEETKRILVKEKEFKSVVWMSQGGDGNDLKEVEEENEQPDTARRVETSIEKAEEAKTKNDGSDDEGKKEDEDGQKETEEKEEERETEAEKAERELLGTKSEDLPEDKEAELEEKEAIKKAIGPPEPKID